MRKGYRYNDRSQTISKWMERDEKIEQKLNSASLPYTVCCRFCSREMEMMDKFWEFKGKSNKIVVYFYLICRECEVYCQVWEDGKRKDRIPWQCPNCQRRLEKKITRKGSVITTLDKCPHCGYKDAHTLDMSENLPSEIEKDKDWIGDMARFCLNHEEGAKFLQQKEALKRLSKKMESIDAKGEVEEKSNEQLENCWYSSDGIVVKF